VQEEERLSLREAADALGVSEVTARRWVKAGKLKAYQPGRKYLVPRGAIDELLESESGKVRAPSSQEKLFNNGVLEEERRRAEYAPRVEPRINQLASAAAQWERFTDQGLYNLEKLNVEDLQAVDAASLGMVINHSQDARALKQACTPEQLERLEQAVKRYFDANLEFWARVENTLARQRVPDLTERRAEVQARRIEMERLADLA
jgi:excisionase family DNA binding protein